MSLTNPNTWTTTQLPTSPRWSRSENGSVLTYEYLIAGPNNPKYVLSTLGYASTPVPAHLSSHPDFSTLWCTNVEVTPLANLANPHCLMTLTYAQMLGWTDHLENWQWDVGTKQTRITSVNGPAYVTHIPAADDYGLAINVKGDDAEGVDVFRGSDSMRVQKLWNSVTAAGRRILFDMTPSMNAFYFFEYAPGECLFIGAQIDKQPSGMTMITYNFLTAPDLGAYDIELIDYGPASIAPYPFDYAWFVPGKTTVTGWDGAEIPSTGIRSAHICEVYNWVDFGVLLLQGP